jgi:hypothetical protein
MCAFRNDPMTRISPDQMFVSTLGDDNVLRINRLLDEPCEIILTQEQTAEVIRKLENARR